MTDSPGRTLGWLEHFFFTSNLRNVSVADIEAKLDPDRLEQASRAVQELHPNLNLNVATADDGNSLHFYRTAASVPFAYQSVTLAVWEQELEKEMNHSYDSGTGAPLWRVRCVHIEDAPITKLCVSFHHVIGDGTSGALLIEKILCAYHEPSSQAGLPLPFLPDAETLSFPSGLSEQDIRRAQNIMDNLASSRAQWSPAIAYERCPQIRPPNSFLLGEIEPSSFAKLKQKSKEAGVTVGALLATCLHFAVAKLHLTSNASAALPYRFCHDLDANLRDRIEPKLGDEHIGLLIGMFQLDVTIEAGSILFWELAKQIGRQMAASVSNQEPKLYHAANRMLDAKGAVTNPEHPDRCIDLNFSNVGHHKFLDTDSHPLLKYSGLTVTRLHTVGNWCPAVGTHVFLAHTVSGRLCTSWVYERSAGNELAARMLLDGMLSLLRRIASDACNFTFDDYLNAT